MMTRARSYLIICLVFVTANVGFALSPRDYVEITEADGVRIEMRYASSNNFMKAPVYGPFNRCVVHRDAAAKLKAAVAALKKSKPDWKLLILDCLRPREIQRKLWDRVGEMIARGELPGVTFDNRADYVANPATGSIHNYGLAVDLTLEDERGREVDMGTQFDDFSSLAHARPAEERAFLRDGRLKQSQLDNRLVLRQAMTGAGFIQQPTEWWHYDGKPKAEVKANYVIIERASDLAAVPRSR